MTGTSGWNINMAERHFVNGGGALNWSLTANWSLTEGGAGGQAVPTAAEDVFFDVGSPACIVNATNRVCKTLTASAYMATLTFTYNISVSGNITVGQNMGWAGAGYLVMLAAGTWTSNGATIGVNIGIGNFTAGTVTLAGNLTTSGNLLLSNLTSTTFSGDFHITAATCSTDGSQTITLVHDVTITGLTEISTATVLNGLFNWNTGGLLMTNFVSGTATIVLTGGTWSGAASKNVTNALVFAGNITLSGNIYYNGPSITWQSGTITQGTSVLRLATAAITFNTEGMSWYSIYLDAGVSVITINSLLSATGTLTWASDAAVTFGGTAGWVVGTFTGVLTSGSATCTLKEGITYTITNAFNADHTMAQSVRYTITSAHASTKAILTLAYGATQAVHFVNATGLDSSLGQPIFEPKGTITTCYNWSNSLGQGNIIPGAGGESVAVAGITKNNSGVALGSCDVYLFRDNGNDTATYIAYQESNSVTGAYSFTVFPGSAYFVVAFKGGATPVMDVTYRDLAAV